MLCTRGNTLVFLGGQLDVQMINVDWEPGADERLLMPGDVVLAIDRRGEELGTPEGVLFQAQVLDIRPSSRNAAIRCQGRVVHLMLMSCAICLVLLRCLGRKHRAMPMPADHAPAASLQWVGGCVG